MRHRQADIDSNQNQLRIRSGYRTVAAADGPTALAQINNGEKFDLLFTDVIVPGGMSGRQLAEEVEKLRPGMKVLYTSGYTDSAIIHHGRLDPGVHCF